MTAIIKVENLSKKYIIGHQKRERYTALRDVMARKAKSLGQRICHPLSHSDEDSIKEEFWALKDINFEINQGDIVGIIGRNGAGKSTLLKILSRITEPSTGRLTIKGRVASLLEVGTGFHPELTGRENIFLNGAILGMGKKEITRKFDEIVDFAEVEKFLDTPVKRYSSGMYVRLAFAVAAHLDPELLFVDEVLAVGDAAFQEKCIGKMQNACNQGRTVLFVSHKIESILTLCSKGILLENGYLKSYGAIEKIIDDYLITYNTFENIYIDRNVAYKTENEFIKIKEIYLEAPCLDCIKTNDKIIINIVYDKINNTISPAFIFIFKDIYGTEIFRLSSMPISGFRIKELHESGHVSLTIDRLPLVAGKYFIDIGFVREGLSWLLSLEKVIQLNILGHDVYGSNFILDRSKGLIVVDHKWSHEEVIP